MYVLINYLLDDLFYENVHKIFLKMFYSTSSLFPKLKSFLENELNLRK